MLTFDIKDNIISSYFLFNKNVLFEFVIFLESHPIKWVNVLEDNQKNVKLLLTLSLRILVLFFVLKFSFKIILFEEVRNMQETLELILQEVREVKNKVEILENKVDTLGKKVDTLEKKVDTLGKKVDTLEKKVDTLEKKVDTLEIKVNNLEKKIDDLEERFDKKLAEQENRLIKMMDKKIEEAISKQSQEIATEFHNLITYLDKRFKNIENKLDEEILNNKIAHESYEARLYKLETAQNYLEKKILAQNI